MSRSSPKVELTGAEWKVMQALWRRSPATARDLLDALHGETSWAYTTVKSLLARLVDKGAASMRLRANTSLYEPLIAEGDARRTEVRALADRAFEGELLPMLRFVLTDEKLTAGDRAELREILDRSARRRRGDDDRS